MLLNVAEKTQSREAALSLYIGLLTHNRTHNHHLIDKVISVSYDRVMQLSTEETNKVLNIFDNEGLVCSTVLCDGLFTTGNLVIITIQQHPEGIPFMAHNYLTLSHNMCHTITLVSGGNTKIQNNRFNQSRSSVCQKYTLVFH